MAARSSLLRPSFGYVSSVVAVPPALAPRLVRLARHGYPDRLLMRWRQVVVLYLVLAALAGEYWFVERRREPRGAAEVAPPPPFLRLDPAPLREIRLVRGGRTVITRREGEGWTRVEPAGAPRPSGLLPRLLQRPAHTSQVHPAAV